MSTPDAAATRLLLLADGRRGTGSGTEAKIRRYRLARLGLEDRARQPIQPRYAYLKRAYD